MKTFSTRNSIELCRVARLTIAPGTTGKGVQAKKEKRRTIREDLRGKESRLSVEWSTYIARNAAPSLARGECAQFATSRVAGPGVPSRTRRKGMAKETRGGCTSPSEGHRTSQEM